MRKTADWTKRNLPASFWRGRGGSAREPLFTYGAENPGPLEGKSLFETHCSPACLTSNRQAYSLCVCANAYLNIPHPKLRKPCLYKLEKEKEREGERGRDLTRCWKEKNKKEERKRESKGGGAKEVSKAFFAVVAMAARLTIHTASTTVAWRNQRDQPPFIPLMQKYTLIIWNPHQPTHPGLLLCFQLGPLACRGKKKNI